MAGENLLTRSVLGKANDPFLNQALQAIFNDLKTLSDNPAGGLTLKTNGVTNISQVLLNLIQGTNITITDNGFGGITIDATGGGSGITYGGAVTAGHNNEVLYIDGSGNLVSDTG